MQGTQLHLFEDEAPETTRRPAAEFEDSPAAAWEREAAKRALDDLFSHTSQYRATDAYLKLLRFVRGFRFYAPFNAMLVHVQSPGATYVAPAHRWRTDFGRAVRTGARPLVILQPMGPVMFVFDVSDTEPLADARPLPPEVERPFEAAAAGNVEGELERLIESAKRDGVRVLAEPAGSQSAGSIRSAAPGLAATQAVVSGFDKKTRQPLHVQVPVRYDLLVNSRLDPAARYATIAHELAHLYCGHLGTPDPAWWPDRRGLRREPEEFEAESVAFLVCGRAGVETGSAEYLAGYRKGHAEVPPISLECVLKAAGLIETMSRQRLQARKPPKEGAGR